VRSIAAGFAGRPHQRVRRALCTAQWAVSFVLPVGAILLGRSLVRLLHADLGVSSDHIVTTSLNLGFEKRPTDVEVIRRLQLLLDGIRNIPVCKRPALARHSHHKPVE
jgi:hypothetical protein